MNNYLEVKIGDKIIGLKFGLPAVRRIWEAQEKYDTNTIIEGKDMGYNALGIAHVFFAAYLNDRISREKMPELEFVFFYDFVEQAFFTRHQTSDWDLCQEVVRFMGDTFKVMAESSQKKTSEIPIIPEIPEIPAQQETKTPIISILQPSGNGSNNGATAHSG